MNFKHAIHDVNREYSFYIFVEPTNVCGERFSFSLWSLQFVSCRGRITKYIFSFGGDLQHNWRHYDDRLVEQKWLQQIYTETPEIQ